MDGTEPRSCLNVALGVTGTESSGSAISANSSRTTKLHYEFALPT
jgi:hypothetical protein